VLDLGIRKSGGSRTALNHNLPSRYGHECMQTGGLILSGPCISNKLRVDRRRAHLTTVARLIGRSPQWAIRVTSISCEQNYLSAHASKMVCAIRQATICICVIGRVGGGVRRHERGWSHDDSCCFSSDALHAALIRELIVGGADNPLSLSPLRSD